MSNIYFTKDLVSGDTTWMQMPPRERSWTGLNRRILRDFAIQHGLGKSKLVYIFSFVFVFIVQQSTAVCVYVWPSASVVHGSSLQLLLFANVENL
jgi:hypothetical protein